MKNQEQHMPKVSIKGNQLTLPDELRQALTTAEDDSLNAEEVVEGILLRRSPSARRKAGLANLREAQSGVRYSGPLPRPSASACCALSCARWSSIRSAFPARSGSGSCG